MYGWHLPALATIVVLLSGCGEFEQFGCQVTGSGPKETFSRTVSAYTKMEVDSGIEVQVSVGAASSLSFSMYSNVKDYLVVEVDGDTLTLKMKNGACNPQVSATISVTKPLEGLIANGGSPVTLDTLSGALTANGGSHVTLDTLSGALTANGGSHVTLNGELSGPITANGGSQVAVQKYTSPSAVSIHAAGGSTVQVSTGDASHVDLDVEGGSTVKGIVVDTLSVDVSGGSTVKATVRTSASGTCSGGGSVTLEGTMATDTIKASGGCVLSGPGHAALSMPIST